MPTIEILEADLNRPDHERDVLALTLAYALDDFGNGGPLPTDVEQRLIDGLRNHPTTLIFLAYRNTEAVGIANCFVGFSTFLARPIINIHDLAVLPAHRGQGIGRALLTAIDRKATELGCGKITLEVGENNQRARHLYESAGFQYAMASSTAGGALFYTKKIRLDSSHSPVENK